MGGRRGAGVQRGVAANARGIRLGIRVQVSVDVRLGLLRLLRPPSSQGGAAGTQDSKPTQDIDEPLGGHRKRGREGRRKVRDVHQAQPGHIRF